MPLSKYYKDTKLVAYRNLVIYFIGRALLRKAMYGNDENLTPVTQWDAVRWLSADANAVLAACESSSAALVEARRSLRWWWHPDRNHAPAAAAVFAQVESLFSDALTMLETASRPSLKGWQAGVPQPLELKDGDGRHYRFHHQFAFDSGDAVAYCGRRRVAYQYPDEARAVVEAFEARLAALPFADAHMRRGMGHSVPQCCATYSNANPSSAGAGVVVVQKPREFVPLVAVTEALEGVWAPRDVAWVVSGLFNLACYLEFAGLAHQAILPGNCLISPAGHGVLLAGGWGYAQPDGAPLTWLPAASAAVASPTYMAARRADCRFDRHLIRALALTLLAGAGTHGRSRAEPRHRDDAMHEFLYLPPADSAVVDYGRWQHALSQTFGERRFTPLAVSAEDVYAAATASH